VAPWQLVAYLHGDPKATVVPTTGAHHSEPALTG
jgi:hypothetical protein